MSEQWQEDEASLRPYDREQAELERQTDALVLKTVTSLVSAAEDLKARLRRDTDSLLEEFRRTKRGLENDISMAGAERQRLRDEAESERDRILDDARAEADRIIREAHQERESLLRDVREMEQRLRALETQILQVLGASSASGGGSSAAERTTSTTTPTGQSMGGAAGVAPGVTTSPSPGLATVAASPASTPAPAPSASPPPAVDVEDDPAASEFEVDTTPLGEPGPADQLEVGTAASTAPGAATASPAAPTRADESELSVAASTPTQLTAPSTTRTDEAVEVPTAPVGATVPPAATTLPAPKLATAADEPTETARGLQLVFDGVPGYQQAAAIERAVGDLVDDGEVEIIEFEQGQLVLQVEAVNPRALADRLLAKPPLPMRLVASGQDSATFQLTAG